MNYQERYTQWITEQIFDEETKSELIQIKTDTKEIEDRFYKDLEFGTGGLRGVIGAGTNRMNRYTVGRATQGLANYILKKNIQSPSVAIAYDSRRFSREFAEEAAKVLNANGIKVYLFSELRPTPELSFAVREFKATAGLVITASHNPPEYNGYKVYWNDGAQVISPIAEELIAEANAIQNFSDIKRMDSLTNDKSLLEIIGEEFDEKYIAKVKTLSLNEEIVKEISDELKIVFTPLHGSGNKPVRKILKEVGFKNVIVVPEQELPDPNFSTVKYPNPEEKDAFRLAIDLAKSENADLIIGTDPDCDRVGVVVRNSSGEYVVLTGNQTGALLIEYLLSSLKQQGKLNQKSTIINTIVTGKMGDKIAKAYGAGVISVLTGFKYIADKVKSFEAAGDREFIFGYEESYGYLAGNFVRDKDAVIASMLICEMAACYKKKGMTLYEGLMELYSKYGFHAESTASIAFKGKEGMEMMRDLLNKMRADAPQTINGLKVVEVRDYMVYEGAIKLPKENVLYFTLEDESWFCLRPSGTEPKLKIYFSVTGKSLEDAAIRINSLKKSVENCVAEY